MSAVSQQKTDFWQNHDRQHHLYPFTDHKDLAEKGGSRIITRAYGVYICDSEGRQIDQLLEKAWRCLDLTAGAMRAR